MTNKGIINSLILILIVSLACAAIYATETGEVSYSDSNNVDDLIDINQSIDDSHVVSYDTPDKVNNVTTLALHI